MGKRVSEMRLSLTTGVFNLALCPLRAMPMCHGAGGLAAHHRFGARTGLGIGVLGLMLLLTAGVPADTALHVLSLVPMAVLGALLLVTAFELAALRRVVDATPSCKAVIGVTAAVTLLVNPTVAFAAGLAAEVCGGGWCMRFWGSMSHLDPTHRDKS